MLDGDPAWPDLASSGDWPGETGATSWASPAVPDGLPQGGHQPGARFDLSSLEPVARPARRCPPRATRRSTSSSGPICCWSTASGGTDVCSGIVSGSPLRRSTRARSPAPAWASTPAFDEDGNEVVGELGELVITTPMPSMPVAPVERPRRQPLPRRVLRHATPACGARATGSRSPSAAAA